jgi:hypothetical protein
MTRNIRKNELPLIANGDVVYLANTIIVSPDGTMPIKKATVVEGMIGNWKRQCPRVFEWSELDREPVSISWSEGVDRTRIFTRNEAVSAVMALDPSVDAQASVDDMLLQQSTYSLVSKAIGMTLLERMLPNEVTKFRLC